MRFPLAIVVTLALAPTTLSQSKPSTATPTVQAAATNSLLSYTVQVTAAPAHAEARAAAKNRPEIRIVEGKPVLHLTPEFAAQSVEAPQGSLILVEAAPGTGALGVTLSAPGVLAPVQGLHFMPRGVVGMLTAINPGTVTVSVVGLARTAFAPTLSFGTDPAWAGYDIHGGPFLSIAGEWHVPTVFSDGGDNVAAWIGIDDSKTIIQTGTLSNYSSGWFGTGLFGGTSYSAWYQLFPSDPVFFSNNVSGGDHMIAILSLSGDANPGSPMNWLIFVMNETKNWTYTKNVTYSGKLASAEWVVERPMSCGWFSCSLSSLADFSPITFDTFDLINSGSPNLNTSESITMVSGNTAIATPSVPDGDLDGFTVAYGSLQPFQPGPWIVTTTLPDAYLNLPYQTQISAVGANSFVWSAGSLPSWLTLNPNTGLLSGTPPAAGPSFFSVLARDASNQNDSSQVQPFSLLVQTNPPPPDFSLSANPSVIHVGNTVAGCIATTIITVTPLYGFHSPVQLSASGQGISSPQFNPSSTDTTSHLTFHSACTGTVDGYLLTVTGTSGAITHSIQLDVVPKTVTGCTLPGNQPLRVCPQTP